MNRSKSWLVLAVLSSYPAFAATYTADAASGSDNNSGSASQPFRTVSKCVSSLRQPGDVCELRGGIYEAGGVLNASGTSTNPIVVQAKAGESAILRQGIQPVWASSGNNTWSAVFDYKGLLTAQRANSNYYERGIRLWQDSKALTEACFPNLPAGPTGMHPTIPAEAGTSVTIVKNSQIPSGDLRGARAVSYPFLRQAAECRKVSSSGTGLVNVNAGYYGMQVGNPFYLEGAKALMDQDWEWAWDEPSGKLWIQMPATVDPNLMKVRIQNSSTAFQVNGSYVSIRGLQFQGVVPVVAAGSYGIRYEGLNINEPGILRFSDVEQDYLQLAGLVVRAGAVVTHSVIDGCNGRCIDVAGDGVLVEHNFIRNGTRLGQYEGAISIHGRNARIERNRIENSGHDGIGFMSRGVEGSIVRRNWIVNSGLQAWDAAGITVGSHPNGQVNIDSNLVMNVFKGGAGIFVDESSQRNYVDHNVVGGTDVGVVGQAAIAAKIYTFRNNYIWHNTILPGVPVSFAVREINELGASQFSNNITTALPTVQTIIRTYPSSLSSRISSPNEYFSWGAAWSGNLEATIDPRVKDVAQQDFSLLPISPAIDIGVVGSWSFKGTRPDAGAVESGTTPWVFGPYDDVVPHIVNPILGFEDASKWNPPVWDNGAYTKVLSSDKVEGNSSLAVTANGYKVLESAPLTQKDINGLGLMKWNMKISAQQPNPYWVGQVQIMINCPSRNLYSAWVGQMDLTGLAQGQWIEMIKPLPASIVSALNGATYSDLKVSLVVNVNSGSGPLLFDDLRFLP